MISKEKFFEYCDKELCLRGTIKSKNCLKEFRRNSCYSKYIQSIEKREKLNQDNKDLNEEEWLSFKQKIVQRDKTCLVWRILKISERIYIVKHFLEQILTVEKSPPDVAHIISRAEAPQLVYDEDNVFLCGRYFHSLLDQYKDLVTQMPIKKEERIKWFERIMHETGKWKPNYNYEDFYKEKVK